MFSALQIAWRYADNNTEVLSLMAMDVYKQYQETAVTHADSVKLVEMLYEGAIRFTRMAQKAIEKQDPENAHNHILRTYAIVAELMATLDFESGGDIAMHLEQCYDYILHLLKEANIKKDGAILDQVLALLTPMLSTWQDAFKNGKPVSAPDSAQLDSQSEGVPVDETQEEEKPSPANPRDHKPLDVVG